jgi:transposase
VTGLGFCRCTGIDYESLAIVFPQLAGIVIHKVDALASQLVITGRGRDASGSCPCCGGATARVHGRYMRTVKDTPVAGRGVTLRIEMVRLKCVTAPCRVRTFTLQIPGLT